MGQKKVEDDSRATEKMELSFTELGQGEEAYIQGGGYYTI